jgi:hypothetical protein
MHSSHLKQNLLSIVLFFSSDGMMFSSVCFGDGNVAWAVDILGRVYFITDVTMKTPLGDRCWWQVWYFLMLPGNFILWWMRGVYSFDILLWFMFNVQQSKIYRKIQVNSDKIIAILCSVKKFLNNAFCILHIAIEVHN